MLSRSCAGGMLVAATTACHANFILVPLLLFAMHLAIFSSMTGFLEVSTGFARAWATVQKALLMLDVSMDGAVALFGLTFIVSNWLLRNEVAREYRNAGPQFSAGAPVKLLACWRRLRVACALRTLLWLHSEDVINVQGRSAEACTQALCLSLHSSVAPRPRRPPLQLHDHS